MIRHAVAVQWGSRVDLDVVEQRHKADAVVLNQSPLSLPLQHQRRRAVVQYNQKYSAITPCLKKTVQNCFFLSELRQISTNLDNFWQKDGKEGLKLCEVHSFATSSNSRYHTTVLNVNVPNC